MSLKVCFGCGITNKTEYFRCIACDQRIDKPYSFSSKEEVLSYFSRGGFTDIAEALKKSQVTWDPTDDFYTQVIETSILLGLEESFSSLDILFYADHPSVGGPYLGIRWPMSEVLDAIQISFRSADGDHRFTVLERSKTEERGANYRFDSSLVRAGVQFELRLIAVYGKSTGPNKKYETSPIMLQQADELDPSSPYVLIRPTTGIKVR